MPRDRSPVPLTGGKPDARVAERAGLQWSIVDTADLRACGLTAKAIEVRVRNGLLYPRHRGVFAWGHPNVPLEGVFLAAVKACGDDAVLSHYSAAVLWRLLKWDARYPEVTVPVRRTHPGISTHRSDRIERASRWGIPVTPPARTLLDLAASKLTDDKLRRAANEALSLKLIKPHQLITSHHRGAKRLRAPAGRRGSSSKGGGSSGSRGRSSRASRREHARGSSGRSPRTIGCPPHRGTTCPSRHR